MLARKLRLNIAEAKWRFRAADYQISAPSFKIIAKRTGKVSRYGFLVTGKVGNAVTRNLMKRWLIETVGDKIASFPTGFDFIFIAYPKSTQGSYEEIRSSLDQVLPKISVLR